MLLVIILSGLEKKVITITRFDKNKFANLLAIAKGDRSINQYALHSGVTSAHISRLLRGLLDTPPGPKTIKKLAKHAHNGVTYNDLMEAVGYFPEGDSSNQTLNEIKILNTLKRTHPHITELFKKVSMLPEDQQEMVAGHWKWALEVVQRQEKYKINRNQHLHVAEEQSKYTVEPPEDDIDVRSTPMAARLEDAESIPLTTELEEIIKDGIRESRQLKREREAKLKQQKKKGKK